MILIRTTNVLQETELILTERNTKFALKINFAAVKVNARKKLFINADLLESHTANIGCMCSIAHYGTNSVHAVETNMGTYLYEEEAEFSFYEHANSIFVCGGQLLSLYRHTFIMI